VQHPIDRVEDALHAPEGKRGCDESRYLAIVGPLIAMCQPHWIGGGTVDIEIAVEPIEDRP